jgi:cyclophilin family peptidyl-prolyl cis-trans isomerase
MDDLMSRDVEVRRRAMQALARIGDSVARPSLERGLADEDGQVVAWAAFGLGRDCEKDSEKAVAQLALRAATWSVSEYVPLPDSRFSVDPIAAISNALGRCGTSLAETTLRSWLRLEMPLAERAALALGTISAKQHRLENTTMVALLDVADSTGDAVPAALFPFTRLSTLDTNIQKRLLTVAGKAIRGKSDAARYAVRALPLAGDSAAPILERVLCEKNNYDSAQRADAVRGLSRLGDAGQQSLRRALLRLLPREDVNSDWLLSTEFGTIVETLDYITDSDAELRPLLDRLARTAIPEKATSAVQRRILILRCQSAAALSGNAITTPSLLACDPTKDGRQGALALCRVLGRAKIRGHRAQVFETLAHSGDPIVRENALRALRSHPEVRESARILADALASGSAGVVATVAGILAEHPERAQNRRQSSNVQSSFLASTQDSERTVRAPHPTPELLLALRKATHFAWEADAIDVRTQLLDAVAALGVLSEKAFVEEQCRSTSTVLRKHAELALHHFSDLKRHCLPPIAAAVSVTARADVETVRLRFYSDIGPLDLWLEPHFAPMATGRLLELAKSGFFDNMPVHRAVAGFVVQLGDRAGDGYGGVGSEALRDELTPVGFGAGDVGLALSGPDTGASQFFVVLGPQPHLDGEYSRVGHAQAGWDRLVVGDVVQSVEQLF